MDSEGRPELLPRLSCMGDLPLMQEHAQEGLSMGASVFAQEDEGSGEVRKGNGQVEERRGEGEKEKSEHRGEKRRQMRDACQHPRSLPDLVKTHVPLSAGTPLWRLPRR